MRLTSTCLQRWMASWIAFIIIWCGDYILYWISHHSKILDILEFLIPLALLFIATSAFAEANFEGERMIQVWQIMFSIFPIIFNKNLRKKLKVLNVLLVEKLFFVAYYMVTNDDMFTALHFVIPGTFLCMLQCIYPTEDRLRVQAFLSQQPLQMKVIVIRLRLYILVHWL